MKFSWASAMALGLELGALFMRAGWIPETVEAVRLCAVMIIDVQQDIAPAALFLLRLFLYKRQLRNRGLLDFCLSGLALLLIARIFYGKNNEVL